MISAFGKGINILKKTVIAAVVSLVMLQSATALAEVSWSENSDTRVITVEGNINGTDATNLISLKVKKEDGTIVYPAFIPTEGGTFKYSFKLPDKSGKYKMIFTPYDEEYKEEIEFEYISNSDMLAILSAVNGAENTDSIISIIDSKHTILNITDRWYNLLTFESKTEMAEMFLEKKTVDYTSLQSVKDDMKEVLSIIAFNVSKTENDIQTAMTDFAQEYAIESNTTLYSEYNGLPDETASLARSIMANGSCNSAESLYKLFDEAVLLSMITKTSQPSDMTALIDNNRALIPFGLTKYDAINKNLLAQYMFGKSILSMNDLERVISESYTMQTSTPVTGGGGSSGGSGYSSGGEGKNSSTQMPYIPKSELVEIKPQTSEFSDMDKAEWAKAAVFYLSEKGIVSGVGDNEFNPQGMVTREAFALMIVKAFDLKSSGDMQIFDDVPQNHWAKDAIAAAYENGVISGIGDGKFGLGENIKRQDMAVMIARAAEKCGYLFEKVKNVEASDMAEVSAYALESVNLMIEAGIINGYGEDGTFRPYNNSTRAEASQIIYSVLTGGDIS